MYILELNCWISVHYLLIKLRVGWKWCVWKHTIIDNVWFNPWITYSQHFGCHALWKEPRYENVMRIILSAKDILAARKDFKECGVQLHLWLYLVRVGFIKSITSYVLTNEEKNRFVQIILNLKTLIKNHVIIEKLSSQRWKPQRHEIPWLPHFDARHSTFMYVTFHDKEM